MIDPKNFKTLHQEEKQREIEKGFVYALRQQILLDEKFSNTTNFKVVLNWYIRIVAFNATLRVYAQRFIRSIYPLIYWDPPQHITTSHFLDYCADSLSILEQLKRNKRRKSDLSMINTALNDIITQQQQMFEYVKAGNCWETLFETIDALKHK